MSILTIAGYQFVAIEELAPLRSELLLQCKKYDLRGTILLSHEGLNLSLAGDVHSVYAFQSYLRQDARFAAMSFRESYSASVPFKRLKIKLKKEIITLRQPGTDPLQKRAASLSPEALKEWLDEKKDIVLFDTRNDYEVRFGTFNEALHFELNTFGELPKMAKMLPQDKTIVMFCTGGVRCEKAALYLESAGFTDVYQLDGGILNYFEKVGGAHYQGECFVFDERVSLNSHLETSGTRQCRACQGPVLNQQICCAST